MPHRSQSYRLCLGLFGLLLVSACGHRGSVSHGYSQGEDAAGGATESYSSNVEFGSAVEMRFQDIESHLREGRFEEAIRSSRALFRDQGLDRERRAQALLLWSQAEGSALNPSRRVDSAIARLELLLDEYEGTKAAREGRRTLDRFRSYRENHPG